MAANKTHLTKRGNIWYVQVRVPPSLRPVMPAHLKCSLRTRDYAVARERSWPIIAEFKAQIEAARSGKPIEKPAISLKDEANAFRDWLDRRDPEDICEESGSHIAHELAVERAYQIEAQHDEKTAREFIQVATGAATPLDHYVETWLKTYYAKPRTIKDHKRALKRLMDWNEKRRKHLSLEKLTRSVASDFIHDDLVDALAPKTVQKYVTSLSAYWTWLENNGKVNENIWLRITPSGARSRKQRQREQERPFTQEEVIRLFQGDPESDLLAIMSIAALTGMRINEIYMLTVDDCSGGYFNIREAKTDAGVRKVPIHSDIQGIIEGLCTGKTGTEFLIASRRSTMTSTEASMPMSKFFGRYRKKPNVNVHEARTGLRRSLVNFHSFRRWFAQQAEYAGQPLQVIENVIGHVSDRLVINTYTRERSDEQLRACVEAVRLPEECLQVISLRFPSMSKAA